MATCLVQRKDGGPTALFAAESPKDTSMSELPMEIIKVRCSGEGCGRVWERIAVWPFADFGLLAVADLKNTNYVLTNSKVHPVVKCPNKS